MKTITLEDWYKEAESKFGKDKKEWRFQCPQCGHVQTMKDFLDNNVEEAVNKFYFSCLGRWVPSRGCDWTLGGLFQIHKVEVIHPEGGKNIPVFEFAESNSVTPKQ